MSQLLRFWKTSYRRTLWKIIVYKSTNTGYHRSKNVPTSSKISGHQCRSSHSVYKWFSSSHRLVVRKLVVEENRAHKLWNLNYFLFSGNLALGRITAFWSHPKKTLIDRHVQNHSFNKITHVGLFLSTPYRANKWNCSIRCATLTTRIKYSAFLHGIEVALQWT